MFMGPDSALIDKFQRTEPISLPSNTGVLTAKTPRRELFNLSVNAFFKS